MGGCSAINCSNHSRKKHRMFKFPADPTRRRIWTINCRRDAWVPGPNAQLCSEHFEENQFEQNRADNWKKLKQDAIPTLFDVPNPPPSIGPTRIKGIGKPKPGSLLQMRKNVPQESEINVLKKRIAELEAENKSLREQLQEIKNQQFTFLTPEQKKFALIPKSSIAKWSDEGILKGLRMRFALGKFGYMYLLSTGYPSPSYSTINRKIQHIDMSFGVLENIMTILKAKVDILDANDRWCSIIVDEMEISKNKDYDVSKKCFVGNVTLGADAVIGNHYTVVLLRGVKSAWKQVIAHEITGHSTAGEKMKNLIASSVKACRKVGLKIKAMTSDMGSNNQSMWKVFGIKVTRNERSTSFNLEDEEKIHAVADVPHLLKNLRSAFLSRDLTLPTSICEEQDLPSKFVSSSFIKKLWLAEENADSCLRSLHHLNKEHLFLTHFNTMNVATAVQLFSIATAAAIEKAVYFKLMSKEALTTAWFVRLVHQWFQIMSARHRKKGITVRNKDVKFQFLNDFVDIIQNMQLGDGWKPVQTGIILSTLSIMNLSAEAFKAGFSFFLPGRLTQDALENVFSQIRKKSGLKPTALKAKRALKLICISQFLADIKGSNYSMTYDKNLLDVSLLNQARQENQDSSATTLPSSSTLLPSSATVLPSTSTVLPSTSTALPSTSTALQSTSSVLQSLQSSPMTTSARTSIASSSKPLTASEENDVYYIAGVTLHSILKLKLCDRCILSARTAIDQTCADVPRHLTLLTDYSDMGGLLKPTSGIYRICREAERELQHNKKIWDNAEMPINKINIDAIINNCRHVDMPLCCSLKPRIINYYLNIRCRGILKHAANKAAYEHSYASASAAKKL